MSRGQRQATAKFEFFFQCPLTSQPEPDAGHVTDFF